MSDEAAVKRLEELLAQHGGLLRATIGRMCPAHMGIAVDDVLQDARIRLWRAIESEREITSPASYIHRMAVTATLDAIRRVKARREEPLEAPSDEGSEKPRVEADPAAALEATPSTSPERRASGRLVADAIRRALRELAADRRRAVALYLQGMGSQEIGDACGWSEPRSRNLLYRGLEDLRVRLRARGIDDSSAV